MHKSREYARESTVKLIAIALIIATGATTVKATDYVTESFTGSNAVGWTFTSGQGVGASLTAATGIDLEDEGWLRLTEDTYNQSTFVYYNTAISTANGLVFTFDFVIWSTNSSTVADGMTLCIFDATATPGPGGFGGSLGYSKRSGIQGLTGGIVGFGFDAFGNYSNPTEGRIGGPGYVKNAIAIRGSMGATRNDGYEYVTGTSSLTGLSTGGVTNRDDVTIRTVRITIPVDKKISIDWKTAGAESWTTLIDEYQCTLSCPDEIKFGFTAGTGGVRGSHEISNLSVTSDPGTTSSGIDLRAYQGADGVYVEFLVYDVESAGTVTLAMLGPDGSTIWTGTANVVVAAEQVCRFLVPDLAVGGMYDFAVRDEVGTAWSAPSVIVGSFTVELNRMSPTDTMLSFSSLPGREYKIQWTDRIGTAWQTRTTVLADSDRTFVAFPELKGQSGFFRVVLK